MTKDEALTLALGALEYASTGNRRPELIAPAITAIREALAEQPAQQQEQGDSNYQDDDGCPIEMAVLQRFWRGEPIPTEKYPAWFKPAQPEQEPVAFSQFLTDVVTAAGLLSHGKRDKALAARISQFAFHLRTAPPAAQRKPLTDEQIADIIVEMNGNEPTALFWRDLTRAIEAAHGIKENT